MNILLTICARGGSKGVKNKNIKELAGKPLMYYTIKVAKEWDLANKIICSTDSDEIAEVAKEYGVDVPFKRPEILATDTSGKVPVIRHALIEAEKTYGKEFDIVVDLDVTSPLRTVTDLNNALNQFIKQDAEVLFSVVDARKNPYFNMIELNGDGYATISKKLDHNILRRQDAPEVYEANASIYFYKRSFLLNEDNGTVLSSKRAVIFKMEDSKSIDVDTEMDFKFIEFLIKNGVITI
jgi:CMP-N,N'-diacetyllegionaminic acid synthase